MSTRRTVTVASPIGARTELTPAADQLLRDLEARVYLARQCWLVAAPRGRNAVVVPVDYSHVPERLRTVNDGTAYELARYGLVDLGDWQDAPRYAWRSPTDRNRGRTITPTQLGRQRLSELALQLEADNIRAQAATP